MPIVEIDGVGRVELDDSFTQLSPQQQEATINEIVQQSRRSKAPAPAAPSAPQMGQEAPSGNEPEIYAPDGFGGNAYDPATDKFNDTWAAQQEAEYQNSLKGQKPSAPKLDSNEIVTKADKTGQWEAAGLGALDGLSFSFDDEIGSAAAALIPGVGKSSVWDGKSFSDAYGDNVDAYRGMKDAAADEHLGMYLGGGLAAGFVPIAGPLNRMFTAGRGVKGALKAAETAHEASRAARYGKAAAVGAGVGGLYGIGSDEGGITDRLDGGLEGALIGVPLGMAGEKVSTAIGRALKPEIKDTRFAQKQMETNPFAAFDAEIVDDLSNAVQSRAVSKSDPKGRAKLTAKTINSLEQSYFVEMKNAMNALDMDPGEKLKLWQALGSKYAISADEVNALRGSVAGDAVADAITKVQRLRELTPELKSKSGILTKAANAADFIPGVPGIVGRSMRGIARASGDGEAARVNAADKLLSKRSGYAKLGEMAGPSGARESRNALFDAAVQKQEEAMAEAAATQAERATRPTKADRAEFKNEITGNTLDERDYTYAPTRTKQALNAAAKLERGMERRSERWAEQLATDPKEAPITAKDRRALLAQITDPTPDMRDARNLVPTDAKLASRVKARDDALSKMEREAADWDAALADPSTAPAPKSIRSPSLRDQLIEKATSEGIEGTSGTRAAFRSRLGVNDEDLNKVLDKVAEDFPEAASEIGRIKLNHPTQDRKLWSAIGSHMTKARDDLGIKPKEADAPLELTSPLDEAAQKRLENTAEQAPTASRQAAQAAFDEADAAWRQAQADDAAMFDQTGLDRTQRPTASAVDQAFNRREQAQQELRGIDRPIQHQQGKEMFQQQANDSIAAMQRDPSISSISMDALGNAPRQIRDNFRTTKEATDFIDSQVLPDLEAEGVPVSEIRKVKAYLYEVAQAKRYADPDALEAGTRYRSRGRPKAED